MLVGGSRCLPGRRLFVFCGKGNNGSSGKGKASKSGSEKSNTAPQPPRVATDSTYSLKQQLRFVKSMKRWEARQSAAPATRSKFRKPKIKDTTEGSRIQQGSNGTGCFATDRSQDETILSRGKGISSLYDSKVQNNPPAILVDGYNVLMLWIDQPGDRARKRSVANDLQGARDLILRDFADFTEWRKFRMMVAFDAQGNPNAPLITRGNSGGVETVFIGGVEADSFIIKEAEKLRMSGCPYVLVASSDGDIRDACWKDEIIPISSIQLLREMKRAQKEMHAYYQEKKDRLSAGRLGASLQKANPSLYNKLEQVRVNGVKKPENGAQ